MELLTKKEAEFKALKNSQPTRSVGTEDAEGAASERLTRGVGTRHLRVRASEGPGLPSHRGRRGRLQGGPPSAAVAGGATAECRAVGQGAHSHA